jgi:seryl-tRNA synthetase
VSRKHKLLEKSEPVEIDLIEMIKSLNERLEKQEKQIDEQKKQIDHIISEIF